MYNRREIFSRRLLPHPPFIILFQWVQTNTFLLIFFRRVSLMVSTSNDPFNIWGGRGCNNFDPVSGENGTKIAPTGDIFE